MKIFRFAVLLATVFFAAGCGGSKVFLHFSSPDGTPLRDGDVTVRYAYLSGVIRDPSGVTVPRARTVAERLSPCKGTVSFSAPAQIIWLAVDALYPGHLPLRFRIDRAGADAPRMYELSELDPHYIPLDLKITAKKRRISVSAALRFP